jgi:hypothetical protein
MEATKASELHRQQTHKAETNPIAIIVMARFRGFIFSSVSGAESLVTCAPDISNELLAQQAARYPKSKSETQDAASREVFNPTWKIKSAPARDRSESEFALLRAQGNSAPLERNSLA